MAERIEVKAGQVWADNDWRCEGRTLRVDRVEDGRAYCVVLTNSDTVQQHLNQRQVSTSSDRRGKTTRIALSRFVPSSTGYRLVADAPVQDLTGEEERP